MSAREQILKSIAANKPELVDLPIIDKQQVISYEDNTVQFKKVLESIGGSVMEASSMEQLQTEFETEKLSGKYIVNTIAELNIVDENLNNLSSHQLESVHKAFIRGTVGVAENGSVWVYESQMINRLLPFICQHLVLIIEKNDIVATMHHAYEKIDSARDGFGVFIAGPSKTADIEQSLVIGAHGARSLVVYILD